MSHRLLVVVCQLFLVVGGIPLKILHSPCSDIFRYEKIPFEGHGDWVFPSEDHRWRGVITVPRTLPIFLKVKLLAPVPLPSKYVGRIELAQDKEEIVRKITEGSLDKIKYYVYFPAKIPVPELILVEVNSLVLCSQTLAPRRIKTILTLEHSLLPLTSNISLRDGIGIVGNHKAPASGKDLGKTNFCGRGLRGKKKSLGNESIAKGDWPWMVPLFKKTELGLQFMCSSTLINHQFVITAAHCVRLKQEIAKEDIVAYVGRFDIKNWTEDQTQPRELSQIFIHPDYDPENLHSDLALLKLSRAVDFGPYVGPACLWTGEEDLNIVAGRKGMIFGWGTDGRGHKITDKPKLAVMPIVSQEECLRSKMDFLFFTSNRTLCAGFRNGTGPCNGDSGGGLLLPRKDEDGIVRWILRGVVSLSLQQNNQPICDAHEFTVFTDVAKYQNWIEHISRL